MEPAEQKERNPYAPPQAVVTDAVLVEPRGPRPIQVTWAVRLFWLDFALSVVQAFLEWPGRSDGVLSLASQVIGGVVTLGLLGLEAFVIYKISVGRNWARWISLVSVILGVLIAVRSLPVTMITSPVIVGLGAVSTVADVVALYLLFVSPVGRRWFKRA